MPDGMLISQNGLTMDDMLLLNEDGTTTEFTPRTAYSIIDLGCGRYPDRLKAISEERGEGSGLYLLGIDSSLFASVRFGNIDLIKGGAQNVLDTLERSSADRIYADFMLHFIHPDNISYFLKTIAETLRLDGLFQASYPAGTTHYIEQIIDRTGMFRREPTEIMHPLDIQNSPSAIEAHNTYRRLQVDPIALREAREDIGLEQIEPEHYLPFITKAYRI